MSLDTNLDSLVVEENRAIGRVPVATPMQSDALGGNPVSFYSWDQILEEAGFDDREISEYPLPPINCVLDGGEGFDLTARDPHKPGEQYILRGVNDPSSGKTNYAWYDSKLKQVG